MTWLTQRGLQIVVMSASAAGRSSGVAAGQPVGQFP
jgi:hypothetical protein